MQEKTQINKAKGLAWECEASRVPEATICFANTKILRFVLKAALTEAEGVVVGNDTGREKKKE